MNVIMHLKYYKQCIIPIFILFILSCMADLAVAAAPLKITPANLNGNKGQVSTPYSATLTGSNGTTPYFWSITAGSLPPGLFFTQSPSPSLTADISGTPVQSGNFTFTVTLMDSSFPQQILNSSYTISVAPPCSFSGPNIGSISFNNIDPSSSVVPINGTITQQIFIVCKNNFTYTVMASPASGWTIDLGATTIPYTLSYNTGGVGLGATPIALLTNTTQITTYTYANAPGGLYGNTNAVTFTISWTQAGGGSIIAYLQPGGVSGTVLNTCLLSQSPGALSFNIDPSASTVGTSASPDLQIKCTMNAPVSVSATSTCSGSMYSSYPPSCSGNAIPYAFKCLGSVVGCSGTVSGSGFGGAGASFGISGSATSVGYANAPIGNYGDLQTITISY